MIYIDLINGSPAIDWERYNRLRNLFSEPSQKYMFTHRAIASLEGNPDQKLKQLEKILGCSAIYDFAHKDDKYCCRATWQDRRGYGVGDSGFEAMTLAQTDLFSILCDDPIDAYRTNETWEKFINWDE